ncbi:DnaD domain protein [Ruminococcus flavefaciens]|uniref:DnaD domain protein n=1 Tax=Ruminococcus flavefaciens TaxID=1265 RepID=UPI000465C3D9|nr:DnaD domain protein [Ruminococcus flavefaciens]
MEFKVNCGIWGAMFGVPSIVADNFLKLATGGQIKVLLYLLRCSGKMCSAEDISSNTGVSPEEAEEAVLFWQQANVLSPQANSAPAPVPSLMEQPVTNRSEAAPAQKSTEPAPDHKVNLSGQEIAAIMKDSQDIRELFTIAENILGTLKNSQMNSIIWMYDHLGLKKEVIITLISYCTSIEKTNTAYIEKIASVWAENDINTMAAAQDEIQRLSASRDYISGIMRAFEMTRRPTTKQTELIQQWKNAGFSVELLRYAYEKTVERIDKLNFDYINKILLSWRDSGFATVQDVKNAETDYRNKKTASKSSMNDTDVEEYESVINQFLH